MSDETLSQLLSHTLDAQRVLPAIRHLSECVECARKRSRLVDHATDLLRGTFEEDADESHETVVEMLDAYTRGAVDALDRELVEAHLEDCVVCAAQVARRTSGRRTRMIAAAAAAVLVVVIALAAIRRTQDAPARIRRDDAVESSSPSVPIAAPQTPPIPVASSDWRAPIVEPLVATGHLPIAPIVGQLAPVADALRDPSAPGTIRVEPAGVVVRETRPRLEWDVVEGARYAVMILRDGREVTRSEELETATWVPAHDLERGATYAWQVEAMRGDTVEVYPAPPAPSATFHITSDDEERAITRGVTEYPQDHLLHAVLFARAGLVDEANRALGLAKTSGDPRAMKVQPIR